MTIRLSWPSQASKGLTAIEIYRKEGWNATIDVYNPGTPHATLSGNAVEFVDNIDTLTKNTTYRYWVAAVKTVNDLSAIRLRKDSIRTPGRVRKLFCVVTGLQVISVQYRIQSSLIQPS